MGRSSGATCDTEDSRVWVVGLDVKAADDEIWVAIARREQTGKV